MSKSLVAIVGEVNSLEAMLIESEGQIDEAIENALAVKEIELPEKVDQYFYTFERFKVLEAYYKERAQFFSLVQKQCANVQTRLKENMKEAMSSLGVDEIQGNDIRYKLSKSKPALQIENEELIPKQYKKEVVTIELNKKALAEDLTMGEIPGAKLVDSFSLRPYPNTPSKKAGSK